MVECIDLASFCPADRLPAWHELIWRSYVRLDITATVDEPGRFAGAIRTAQLGDMRIASSSSSAAHRISRPRRLTGQGDERLIMLGRQVSGRGRVRQAGSEAHLDVGDFVLWDTESPYDIQFTKDWGMQVFQFPQRRLPLAERDAPQVLGRTFSTTDPFFRGVSRYLGSLTELDEEFTPNLVAQSSIDLITAAVERRCDLPRPTSRPTSRPHAELRRRALAHVEAHLVDPSLSAAAIARATNVSVRSLHRVFTGQEMTLAQEIRARRMRRIQHDLTDPRLASRTIESIARRWGYPNPAHFSREFTRHFGVSPARWRSSPGSVRLTV
ncbi:helix-turn-helix domain-containing protein [Arsenicicoccus cauae]|uniref:AraC-like ligand-binding domain-containing protein n=1 Tax=Arsenicicoccus cauae TaxID=2663847 RepID=UPI0012B63A11|nr:helix-turn-helix domain-containing protein [Arsenicicoccus cauae]